MNSPIFRGRPTSLTTLFVSFCLPVAAVQAQEDERGDSHHAVDEITVTASPLSRTVEQLAQPTAVLSGDDLTRKQSASIGEVVSAEVGVSSTYFGPVASRPVIRGQFGERVRVLSNGLDSLDASALSEDHQASVDSILSERVEIVRGPATLLYGSGAAGGLINVVDNRISEQPAEEPVAGSVAMNGDTALGSRAGAGRVAFGQGGLTVQLDAFTRHTQDVEIPDFAESALLRALEEAEGGEEHDEAGEGRIENTDSRTDGAALGASWNDDNGFFGFSVSQFDSDYGVAGHAHEEEGEEEEEEIVRIGLEQLRFDVRGDRDLSGPFRTVKFRAAHNNYEHAESEGGAIGTLYDTSGTDVRVELHHETGERVEGAIGLQYKRIDFAAEGDEAFVPPSDTVRKSLFAFEEFAVSSEWALQGSFRAEHQSIDTPVFSPGYSDTAYGASLGAIWNDSESLGVAINLSLTERHPNSTELFADGPHIAVQRFERGSVVQGNGVLDKELSTNVDVTVRGGDDPLQWTVTGFLNRVDDYILLRPGSGMQDDMQVFDYVAADVDLYGIEAESRFEISDTPDGHLHGRVFADFVHAEERTSGNYLPRIPPLRIGLGLHYTRNLLEAGVEATWHADQEQTAVNELPTDGYTLLGAEVSYLLQEQGVFVYLRGKNLTDTDARQHSSPLKDTFPLPGRSLQLGMRWDF